MVIEKLSDCYSLINVELDKEQLLNVYNTFANQMIELDLEKKFKQYNYAYSDNTNPLWKTLDKTEHPYLEIILCKFGLNNVDSVINLSNLPAGFELEKHKDFGRKTVLLIPITGVDAPIYIEDCPVNYKNSSLLMDATKMHSVPKTNHDRITLQFAFRQSFGKILSIVNNPIQKN